MYVILVTMSLNRFFYTFFHVYKVCVLAKTGTHKYYKLRFNMVLEGRGEGCPLLQTWKSETDIWPKDHSSPHCVENCTSPLLLVVRLEFSIQNSTMLCRYEIRILLHISMLEKLPYTLLWTRDCSPTHHCESELHFFMLGDPPPPPPPPPPDPPSRFIFL